MTITLLVVALAALIVNADATYKVERINSPFSEIGEGPHWDVQRQSLYYIDIFGKLLRYDYGLNKTFYATIKYETSTTFIIPIEGTNNQFAVGIGRRIGLVQWNGTSLRAKLLRFLVEVENEPKYFQNRFNDAKADPRGRFFGGTMRSEYDGDIFEASLGSLYSGYLSERKLENIKKYVHVSNGLTWNKEENTFYFVDTGTSDIKAYDYSPDTGIISNERVVVSFYEFGKELKYSPDGLTIDTDGNLYVATFKSNILKVNPRTKEVVVINMPDAGQTSSVAFGGPNLDILYVTTAATDRTEKQPKLAGSLFQITNLNAQGSPANNLKLY